MNTDFLPFAKPCINDDAKQEVMDTLSSGWLSTGPRTKQFEQDLKTYLGADEVIALSSATAGLQLALLSLRLKPGDEVITTPLTFAATINSITNAGGKPVLVDIDPNTLNMDLTRLEDAVTSKTRAIMPVHFAGLPLDLTHLYQFANQYNLRVIEDAAHAIGAGFNGQKIGATGDTQVFSFYANKNMTTGEGGALATSDPELAELVRMLSFHGINRNDAWNRFSKSGQQLYDVIVAGYKYNMSDIQAALGLHQLKQLDVFIENRTKLANSYRDILVEWHQFSYPTGATYNYNHAWHLFNVMIEVDKAGMERDVFVQKMKEQGIGIGIHYTPVHRFSYYQKYFDYKDGDFPIAEDIGARIMSLPLFSDMTIAMQDRVLETMANVLKGR